MRAFVSWLLIFSFSFSTSAFATQAPACADARFIGSINEAVSGLEEICTNANSGKVEKPALGWFKICGTGANVGFGETWTELKSFGAMLSKGAGAGGRGVVAAPGVVYRWSQSVLIWEWNETKGAYNFVFGADPVSKIDRMVKQDAAAARSTYQAIKNQYDAAMLLGERLMEAVAKTAITVVGSSYCLPWDWKFHFLCWFIEQVTTNSVGGVDAVAGLVGRAAKIAMADKLVANFLKDADVVGQMKKLPIAQSFRAKRGLREALSPQLARSRTRQDFIEAYESRTITDRNQNAAWIAEAKRSSQGASGLTVFYDTENSVMKHLNDHVLKDKSLVTSITNLNKQMMMRELKLLRARNPGLEVLPYSDFKSFRYAFKGKLPIDLDRQVQGAFQRANASFAAEVKKLNLVRATDHPETWFKAGLAATADEASAAARISRDMPQATGVAAFSSPHVQAAAARHATDVIETRAAVVANPRLAPLLESRGGGLVPGRDVYGLARKFKDPEKLAEALRTRYPAATLSTSDAASLQTYFSNVDRFSAALHVERRVIVNLDQAKFGGFTADLRNVGPQNLSDLTEGLNGATKASDMIARARISEQRMTALIEKRLLAFKKAVGDIAKCSGDDCVGVPLSAMSRAEKEKLMTQLAIDPLTREIRMGFVGGDVARVADRTILSTHAESIEKAMRNQLEGVIPADRLDVMTFGIDMDSRAVGTGQVSWIAGVAGQGVSATEREAINQALREGVREVNTDLAKIGTRASYQPAGH